MTGFSVEQIENMDRAGLIGLWKKLLPETLPRRASLSFLRYVLAYETQSKDSGGLPAGFKKRLQKQVAGRRSNRPNRSKLEPKPGGRLLREWNGITHVVEIGEGRYVWKGQPYRSLSAIARAITGTHWSGPRFFGLTGVKGK